MFIPALLIGVLTTFVLIKSKAQPEIISLPERAKAVYFINAPKVDVTPFVTSHGTVVPSQIWRGISETNGKIISTHPLLDKGAIINKGETLVQIDPTDYQIAVTQAQAAVSINKAQLTELHLEEKNTQALFDIEKKSLLLSKNELDRKKVMLTENSISQAEYDRENKLYLNQQKTLATLNHSLTLFPIKYERMAAELKKLEAQLSTATLNLDRTSVIMPFNARISEVSVELGQYVRQGELLVIADGMKKAEITVQIPMNRMSQLISSNKAKEIDLTTTQLNDNSFGISALIKLTVNNNANQWEGHVSRISETLDLKTRTIGLIIEVDEPYSNVIPGKRPPLMRGMFVTIELRGKTQPMSIVVPRSAIYHNTLHIINQDNRIETRKITTQFITNNFAIISSGLKENERVLVSDINPIIEGMLVTPIEDEKIYDSLIISTGANVSADLNANIGTNNTGTNKGTAE